MKTITTDGTEDDIHHEKHEMKTLVSCTTMLTSQGFTTQFKAVEAGLQSLTSERTFKPTEVKVLNFYRFEGESNPDDSSILYAIETSDGERGTLTDAYGAYSDTNVNNFIQEVEDIHKKTNKEESL